MCGIIAVLRRRSTRDAPDLAALEAHLATAVARFDAIPTAADPIGDASEVAAILESVDRALSGIPGLSALLGDRLALATLEHRADDLARTLARVDAEVEAVLGAGLVDDVESLNAALVRSKDALWAIRRDRLRSARAVDDLSGGDTSLPAIETYASIQIALSAIDRLEVRGRDSAGLSVLVQGHGLDLADPTVARLVAERRDGLFASGAVRGGIEDGRDSAGQLAFVYKVAAEIGELGDNTAALRAAIRADDLLRLALRSPDAQATVLGHTRWASVGIISEPNAHPLDNEELDASLEPFVLAALNGDIDNHADLRVLEGLQVAAEITTDAKVIPALISRRIAAGVDPTEAFRASVASFEGSVAIAAAAASDPGRVFLALRGSGQALYVGCADDAYVVASEPYGLVEVAPDYLRIDGETMREVGNPASQGQFVVLDARSGGDRDAIIRCSYDGTPLPIDESEWVRAEITTRDVDRGDAPHYLLKEITEAPESFSKTLRGKLVERDGVFDVRLAPAVLPDDLLARLRTRSIRRVAVIGQGTASVAGQSLGVLLRRLLPDDPLTVEVVLATEFSGFGLRDDMRDTLVVAISQSGTTTDTNRTVDLARARGAAVVAIVNRRQSDLVDKSDGVLYTSDGRDVEMSVASTKAFYSQIAAGCLLAPRLAEEIAPGVIAAPATQALLKGLRDLPAAMREVVDRRPTIAAAAHRHAPYRRSWALVGNGVNRIAAQELRIKLSELCYKSIACDATEDKKHIDLSCEPLILVCAAGLSGSNADDVGKELAIYRAHKAAPIVIATDGETRMRAALDTISVPAVHPMLAFVVTAMAGHLFGYEAALAIDATALPLREARALVETLVARRLDPDELLVELTQGLEPLAARYFEGLRSGIFDGQLDAGIAVRLGALLRYGTGVVPLDSYPLEFGKVGTPSTLVEDLTAGLTAVIEQLTRPIDAIKHQAKTVTVGISRSDETLLRVPLVQQVLAAGAARDSLSYRALRTLVDLDPAVASVHGFTRYRIEGDDAHDEHMTIHVVDRGGIATSIPSRTDASPALRGTKHRVVTEREVTVARGRSDGRTFLIVPEVKGFQVTGLTLVHVKIHERVPYEVARQVLRGYRNRYAALQDQVTETEPNFRDELLADLDLVDLLTEPVAALAEHWRS